MAEEPSDAPGPLAPFTFLSDDIVLNIFFKLESTPLSWPRLCCVSTRFSSLICTVCYRSKCLHSVPSAVSALLSSSRETGLPSLEPPGGWAALHKLSVCCPGLLHAGILFENSDFGLEREIGPHESYIVSQSSSSSSSSSIPLPHPPPLDCWSLFDDLYFDTTYDASEAHLPTPLPDGQPIVPGEEVTKKKKKRQWAGPVTSHLASGNRNLSREQGNKLLASRFRGDCLYICDWPGCVHDEEKRKYMLFRGLFKNFKRSRVWRTLNDGKKGKIRLKCAYCECNETWDLHSSFCLRRVFGFHDDGEPVVRAYVCDNGHVSGAWTERPMYT